MRVSLRLLPLATLLAWAPISQAEVSTETEHAVSKETFEAVWSTIHKSYFDPNFGELDWEAIGEKYRPEASKAKDAETLRPILNAMLGELGESHFGVIPGSEDLEEQALVEASEDKEESPPQTEDAQPTEEAPTANPTEGDSDDEYFEPGNYSGIHLRLLGPDVIVSRVMEGSPAAQAGIRAGHRVLRIGKLDVKTFMRKAAKAASGSFSRDYFVLSVLGELMGDPDEGDTMAITVVSPRGDQKPETLTYRPRVYPGKMSMPMANLPSVPIRLETKRLPLPQGDVLYLSFNIFLPEIMGKLRAAILERGENIKGVIVDLRGNPGGIGMMANGLAGLLTDEQYSLGQMIMRSGQVNFVAFPQRDAFLGPMAILVDGMSASTSEIFAAGLQEAKRARVFGRTTMGAALPSFIQILPNGDRLQHAIADMRTASGQRVEGRGVIPDVKVPLRPKKLFTGQDPVLDKAMKWLQNQPNTNTTPETP